MRTRCRKRAATAGALAFLVFVFAPVAVAVDCLDEVFIAGDDAHDDFGCSVDVAPDGTVWVVWTNNGATGRLDEDVVYSFNDGSGWSTPELIHPENGRMDYLPEISIGGDGVPWVIWMDITAEEGYRLRASHWTGTEWAPGETVREGCGRYDSFDIVAADSE
ncbi:MAG: hypothetical protein GF400_01705, partial [Candidatus Eisenbacteria bacterium]|nr:hypothetical protein [Candidatus Eisenbacteria bacterium]